MAQIEKEVYGLVGYEFTVACVKQKLYNYDFADMIRQRLEGVVNFEENKKKDERQKRIRFRGYVSDIGNGLIDNEIKILEKKCSWVGVILRYEANDPFGNVRTILKGLNLKLLSKK